MVLTQFHSNKTMFALFEAGLQRNDTGPNPMLRRYAPCMGLTMLAPFGDLCNHSDGRQSSNFVRK